MSNLFKYASKCIVIIVLALLFITANTTYASEKIETIRVYAVGGGMNYLTDDDNFTNWSQARDYNGIILRESITRSLSEPAQLVVRSDRNSGRYRIYRSLLEFDTSLLPVDAVVLDAKLFLFQSSVHNNSNSTEIVITSHSKPSGTEITREDWKLSNYGSSEHSRGLLELGTYKEFVLTNLEYIEANSSTIYGLLTSYDYDNIDPGFITRNAAFNASEAPGTSTDPYLEITYTYDDGEEENEFPIFTQVKSELPSLEETASWASSTYAWGGSYHCGSTIAACGCVITSLVMAGRHAGLETDILEGEVQPGNMNAYLQSVGGYDEGGALYWLAGAAYFGEYQSDGRIASRVSPFQVRPTSPSDTMNFIDSKLGTSSIVLAYKNGHFVWLPKKTVDGYIVRDPWYYETRTADDEDLGTYYKDYNNQFTDARVLELYDEPRPFIGSNIEARVRTQTAELLFENATGDRVGYVDGQVLVDLSQASYGNTEIISLAGVPAESSDGKHLLVLDAGTEFTISVVGTDVGEYEFEFFTIDEFGETTSFAASGKTYPGVNTVFSFDLATGEITELPLSEADALKLLDLVLAGATEQQRAFFVRWVERLYGSVEELTPSQILQQVEVLETLFEAKKIEHSIVPTVLERLQLLAK